MLLDAKRIKYIHEILTRDTLNKAEVGSFRQDDQTKVLDTQTGKNLYSPHKLGVSNQTARNDLNGLVSEGVLEERKVGKRSQFFPVLNYMKKLQSMQRG